MDNSHKIKVFAISGFNAGDCIVKAGTRTGVFGQGTNEHIFIDREGPYDSSYVFRDTPENRSRYETYMGWYNQTRQEISKKLCATITQMRGEITPS